MLSIPHQTIMKISSTRPPVRNISKPNPWAHVHYVVVGSFLHRSSLKVNGPYIETKCIFFCIKKFITDEMWV